MKQKLFYLLLCMLQFALSTQAQEVPKEEFKPSGKISGQVFADFQYKAHSDSGNIHGGKTQYALANGYSDKYSSFDFRRIYLGYEYNFTERISAQLLLAHESNLDAAGNRTVYIKGANLRYKDIFKGTDIIFGQQTTPTWATLTEVIYGHRWVEKSIADMRGLASATDFGITLQGKYKDETVGYFVMAGNDNGGRPENDKFKRFYCEVWAKFLNKKLVVDLYADYKQTQVIPFAKSAMLLKGVVAYQSDAVTVGVEVISQTLRNYDYFFPTTDTSASARDTGNAVAFGWSVYAFAPIIKDKLEIFARYDAWDPDTKYSSNNTYFYSSINGHVKETFLNIGFDWTAAKNIHLMPNLWLNSYSDKAQGASGKIKSDYDMDVRLTAFWKF